MDRINAPIDLRYVESADGTLIGYYVAGTGKQVWIIPPGLGTPLLSWKYIIEAFQDIYTIVTWDLRGTYHSQKPPSMDHLGIDYHVEDLRAIVEREGFSKFVLGGWSMAVQTSLEYYHHHPEQVRALVLINGAFEHVLSTAFNIPGAGFIFPSLLQIFRTATPVMNQLIPFLLKMDSTPKILNAIKIVSDNFDFFAELAQEFAALDWNVYFKLMLEANKHSARRFLDEVTVPTLITAGTKDAMTPMTAARYMHDRIRDSELFIVPNGTHYTTVEYPEIVNLRLEKFFRCLDPYLFLKIEK